MDPHDKTRGGVDMNPPDSINRRMDIHKYYNINYTLDIGYSRFYIEDNFEILTRY